MDLKSKRDVKAVYATTAEGVVWFAVGRARPRPSGRPAADFLGGSYCRGADEVRIVATPQNSPLIRDAFARSMAGGWAVHLTGPETVPLRATDPAEVVVAARATADQWAPLPEDPVGGRPRSLGGWHRMKAAEWPAYILAAAIVEQDPVVGLEEEFESNPILRRLAFAAPVDRVALLRLVGEIRDPRWFADPERDVDPMKRENMAKLTSYLGLGGARARNVGRRAVLDAAWRREDVEAGMVDADDPRAFVAAYHRHRLPRRGAARAADDAARYFLEFVRSAWLEALCPHVGDGLFAADHFFARVHPERGDFAGAAAAYRGSLPPG